MHRNPEKAYEAGLLVKQEDDPAEVMVTIPEEALKKERKSRTETAPKERTVTQIRTPKEEENVLPDLLDLCREELEKRGLEWGHEDKKDSRYYVLVAVLTDWLKS